MTEFLANIILGATKTQRKPKPKVPEPSLRTMPKGISEKGKELWPEFFKKYKTNIFHSSEIEKQWAAAVAIFTNYCHKRNVAPFSQVDPVDSDLKDKLERKVNIANDKLNVKMQSLIKKLHKNAVLSRVTKEKVKEVGYHPQDGGYLIVTECTINLKAKAVLPYKIFLKENGFDYNRNRDCFVFTEGSHRIDCIKERTDRGNKLVFTKTFVFTPMQIKSVIGVSDSELKDVKKTTSLLSKHVRLILKDDALSHSITANVIELDTPLTEEEEGFLENLRKEVSEKNISITDLTNQYGLKSIQNMRGINYQLKLAETLIAIANEREERPFYQWTMIIEDPEILTR